MTKSYTRQSSFSNGDVIDAPLFNAEFDQLVAAFHEATGHNHDGTAAGGAPVPLIAKDTHGVRVDTNDPLNPKIVFKIDGVDVYSIDSATIADTTQIEHTGFGNTLSLKDYLDTLGNPDNLITDSTDLEHTPADTGVTVFLKPHLDELDLTIDSIEADIATNLSSINTLTTDLNTLEGRVDSLDVNNGSFETRVTTLETEMNAVESRATTLETEMNAVEARATNLETFEAQAGTAYTQDVQTSELDTTAGALMAVGAFGLGDTSDLPNWPNTSLNNLTGVGAGIYRAISSTTDTPDGTNKFVIWYSGFRNITTANEATQLLINVDTGRTYSRGSSGGTPSNPTWSAWRENWDDGNLVKTTSSTDNTEGRIPSIRSYGGIFGLGANRIPSITNADTLSNTGFYSTPSEWTGSPFTGLSSQNQGHVFHQQWLATSYAVQTFYSINSAFLVKVRRKDNNVWSDWVDFWTEENLVKTTSATDTTAGSMLQVGDFGLGTVNPITYPASIDLSSTPNGFYRTVGTTSGTFPSGSQKFGYMLVERYDGNNIKQTFYDTITTTTYVRQVTSNVPSAWKTIWDSSNLPVTVDSSDNVTFPQSIFFGDTEGAFFGDSLDLSVTFNGSNAVIGSSSGGLLLRTTGSGTNVYMDAMGAAYLRTNGATTALLADTNQNVSIPNGNLIVTGQGTFNSPNTRVLNVNYNNTGGCVWQTFRIQGTERWWFSTDTGGTTPTFNLLTSNGGGGYVFQADYTTADINFFGEVKEQGQRVYSPNNKNVDTVRFASSQTKARTAPYTEIAWIDGATGTLTFSASAYVANDVIVIKKLRSAGALTIAITGGTMELPDGTSVASDTLNDGFSGTITLIHTGSGTFELGISG